MTYGDADPTESERYHCTRVLEYIRKYKVPQDYVFLQDYFRFTFHLLLFQALGELAPTGQLFISVTLWNGHLHNDKHRHADRSDRKLTEDKWSQTKGRGREREIQNGKVESEARKFAARATRFSLVYSLHSALVLGGAMLHTGFKFGREDANDLLAL